MLEKCTESSTQSDGSGRLLNVSKIHPDSSFECLAYVRGGQHKFTKAGKPFITLYLQDVEGVVIPGYIFDLANFKAAGHELTKVIGSIVQVKVTENYLPRYGMSVIIESTHIVENVSPQVRSVFVGEVDDTRALFDELLGGIHRHLGIKVSLPFNICTSSYMDFYQGRVGGQCLHYVNMLHTLSVWARTMSKDEARQLFATFVLYVFVHNNYMAAVANGDDDITLVKTLTDSVSKFMQTLKVGDGAIEVIHLFFGYKPKDLFVRTVHYASETNLRVMSELGTFRALPISREGDAGYGTIKRYSSEDA